MTRGSIARRTLLAAVLGAAFFAPATAQAAYAPKLSATVSPTNNPGGGMAFSSTVTQAGDEDATKKAVVHLPVGVAFNVPGLNKITACKPAERDAKACPEGSRIGDAVADTAVGQLSGGVYLGERIEIYIILRNPTLALLGQEPGPITGKTVFRPDGGADSILDNLPTDVTPTRFQLSFHGPPNQVLNSPRICGKIPFIGEFTSKNGATVKSTSFVDFTGCRKPGVALSGLRLAPATVLVGRNAALVYSLNRDAAVEVNVRRRGKRKVLGRTSFAGKEGDSRVRVVTRKLTPGRYIVTIRATADGGSSARGLPLRIKAKPRRR
jgi:hypothetical protein